VSLPKSNSTIESPPPSTPRARKPEADLYTILLAIALVAVLVAILFLYLFMKTYDFKTAPGMAMASHQTPLVASSTFFGP
jgi:hypothetical protein